MSRRVTLPGADELFRATSGSGRAEGPGGERSAPIETTSPGSASLVSAPGSNGSRTRPAASSGGRSRRPSGREKHEEKITVYVSPHELVELERARLTLRADHGLGIDRGRIVREALAVVLADLEAKGPDSILVRRLRDA